MDGLEKILQQIEQDNALQVRQILEQASAEAEKLTQKARLSAEEESAGIIENAHRKAAQRLENAAGECEAIEKRAALKAKGEVINTWMQQALVKAKEMPAEWYFDCLKGLVRAYRHSGGELRLCRADLDRLPEDFMEKVNQGVPEPERITLSPESAIIDAGCVLVYGGIEENCSFDELLCGSADIIKDKLSALLSACV